jgi:hypothetical protein
LGIKRAEISPKNGLSTPRIPSKYGNCTPFDGIAPRRSPVRARLAPSPDSRCKSEVSAPRTQRSGPLPRRRRGGFGVHQLLGRHRVAVQPPLCRSAAPSNGAGREPRKRRVGNAPKAKRRAPARLTPSSRSEVRVAEAAERLGEVSSRTQGMLGAGGVRDDVRCGGESCAGSSCLSGTLRA